MPVRVFLCDDVADLRVLLRLALEEDDRILVVGEAAEAASAIAQVAELAPDVIVLDLSMPGVDGLQAIPPLRAAAPGCRIIVFSGFAAERMELPALAQGADRYVEKGVDLAQVREVVLEVAGAA